MFSGRCARRTRLEPTTTVSQQSSRPTAVLEKPTSESNTIMDTPRAATSSTPTMDLGGSIQLLAVFLIN